MENTGNLENIGQAHNDHKVRLYYEIKNNECIRINYV